MARRMQEHGLRLASVEQKIEQIEADRSAAAAEMMAVERAAEKPVEMTEQAKVVRLHRAYCIARNADFRETWNWLYTEFKYRYRFDAKARTRNRKCRPIDVIEQEGMMGAFFILASDLLVIREAA